MAYEVLILGIDRAGLIKPGSLVISPNADNRNECRFTLRTTAATYLPKVGQDLKVREGAEIKFGGCIKTAKKVKKVPGFGTNKLLEVDIFSDGYSHITARRTINGTWDNKTCGHIVRQLITSFLSQEGITAGTIDEGATLTEYDAACMHCKDILDELAQASGYKWYIDDYKALHFLQEDAIVDAAHELTENGTFKDFFELEVEESLEDYRNKQFVAGGVGDDGYPVIVNIVDDAETAARQAEEGGPEYSTGVYGDVINDTNIDNADDATKAAQNALKRYGIIPQTITFGSRTLDWKKGTRLKVNLPTYGISIDSYYLIESAEIEDEDGKNKVCRITATIRKSDNFSTQRKQSGADYFSNMVRAIKNNSSAGAAGDGSKPVANIKIYYDGLITTYNDKTKINWSFTKDAEGKITSITDNTNNKTIIIDWAEANKP